jgi:hypothetical protein
MTTKPMVYMELDHYLSKLDYIKKTENDLHDEYRKRLIAEEDAAELRKRLDQQSFTFGERVKLATAELRAELEKARALLPEALLQKLKAMQLLVCQRCHGAGYFDNDPTNRCMYCHGTGKS